MQLKLLGQASKSGHSTCGATMGMPPGRYGGNSGRERNKKWGDEPPSKEQGMQPEGRMLLPVPTSALEQAAAFLGLCVPWGTFYAEIVAS